MEMAYDDAIEILNQDSDYEEIDKLKMKTAMAVEKFEDILEAEDAEEIDKETANDMLADTIIECCENTAEIFDLELDDYAFIGEEEEEDEEKSEYSASNNLIFFNENIANTLARMIETEYETEEDGIQAIMEATNADRNTVEGVLRGELVMTPEMGVNVANAFDNLRQSGINQEWNDLIISNYNNTVEALEEEALEAEENGAPRSGSLRDREVALRDRAAENRTLATMQANQNNLMAQFAEFQQAQDLKAELKALNKQTQQMVSQGILTPNEQKDLLGAFETEDEQISFFSETAQQTKVPEWLMLDRIKYTLNFKQRHPSNEFNAFFTEYTDGDRVSDRREMDRATEEYAREYVSRNVFTN